MRIVSSRRGPVTRTDQVEQATKGGKGKKDNGPTTIAITIDTGAVLLIRVLALRSCSGHAVTTGRWISIATMATRAAPGRRQGPLWGYRCALDKFECSRWGSSRLCGAVSLALPS